MKRIEIRCDAANVPSAAIPKILGFILSEIVPDQDPDKMIWFIES
jgi:RimJ/RimL family protein N-acetyltransferase